MSTSPESSAHPVGVLLRFDGVVHASDLPVQSFARHLTRSLPDDRGRTLIAGMRGFLERKPELIPPEVDLTGAEDGYQAVRLLARAAGLTDATISAAHRQSRHDLAASAWAVDESDGLDELRAAVGGSAYIGVLTEPGDPAAAAVLDSVGSSMDGLVPMPIVAALTHLRPQIDSAITADILVIGTRWSGELSEADEAGCTTALVDRYRLGRGTPTLRSPDLRGLVDPIRRWRPIVHRNTTTAWR